MTSRSERPGLAAGRGRAPRSGGAAAIDRGSVTAETAVALPALLAVVAVCMWALGVVAADLRCAEAARAAARVAARGEPSAAVTRAATAAAGRPVHVATGSSGGYVTVRVSWVARPAIPLLARLLPATTVAAEATVHAEPRGGVS